MASEGDGSKRRLRISVLAADRQNQPAQKSLAPEKAWERLRLRILELIADFARLPRPPYGLARRRLLLNVLSGHEARPREPPNLTLPDPVSEPRNSSHWHIAHGDSPDCLAVSRGRRRAKPGSTGALRSHRGHKRVCSEDAA
jgi:hypothetical protein